MGLDPLFLRLVGMHFDPLDYPQVSLHLDLYNTGIGRPPEQMAQIMRCGVERYGARFIPALGVLNDGAGQPDEFVPPPTLRRDLQLARAAGVSELWLFSVNGLNNEDRADAASDAAAGAVRTAGRGLSAVCVTQFSVLGPPS